MEFILQTAPNQKIKRGEWRGRLKATINTGKKMKIYIFLSGHVIITFIGSSFLIHANYNGIMDAKYVLVSIVCTAVFITLIPYTFIDKRIKKEDKRITVKSISALIIVIFFLFSDMLPVLSDAGMKFIGVRKTNVTILLQGSELEMARHLTGNRDQTFFEGDVLFTGVGTSSLLVINNKKIIVRNENLILSY